MWLLNTNTLALEYFVDERAVKYAILSHTWREEEVTFQDIQGQLPTSKKGYAKIQKTCERALSKGYAYCWIDTCCINKESSAELSEAINSMWAYYAAAGTCYAYLDDVTRLQDSSNPLPLRLTNISQRRHHELQTQKPLLHFQNDRTLQHARWFTRGWTLQELIAPRQLIFLDSEWSFLGSRKSLCTALAAITGVDEDLLENGYKSDLSSYSIAARMAWAANRQTTRREDRAYSLLGIFSINMPLLYGEGDTAFQRLQEAILSRSDDQSILAWNCSMPRSSVCALFAPSPDSFEGMSQVVRWNGGPTSRMQLTNVALEINLPIVENGTLLLEGESYAVLNCYLEDNFTGPLALCVSKWATNDDSGAAGYLVQTHHRKGGGSERMCLLPYDVAVKVKPKRCNIGPRFSTHRHWAAPPVKVSNLGAGRPYRPIWISFVAKRGYELAMLRRFPIASWSETGLYYARREDRLLSLSDNDGYVGRDFAPARGKSTSARGSCTLQLKWRQIEGGGLHILGLTDPVVCKLWLGISMCGDEPRVRFHDIAGLEDVVDPGDYYWDRFPKEDPKAVSIQVSPSTWVTAEVKPNQTILAQNLDVVVVSVENQMPEARFQGGQQANGPNMEALLD